MNASTYLCTEACVSCIWWTDKLEIIATTDNKAARHQTEFFFVNANNNIFALNIHPVVKIEPYYSETQSIHIHNVYASPPMMLIAWFQYFFSSFEPHVSVLYFIGILTPNQKERIDDWDWDFLQIVFVDHMITYLSHSKLENCCTDYSY